MNDLSEIKIYFGNEKVQNTHSEENNKDRISDESQIPYLLLHFNENLGKKFYKKTIKEIDSLLKGQNVDDFKKIWKIYILRIRAQLKVIEKKIEKYLILHVEKMKMKHKVNGIKKYLNQVFENLNIFIQKFSVSKTDEALEKVDDLLHCYFEYIYLYCIFNKKIGNIMDTISYLSLFVTLYNETKLILKSNHTLIQLEKCFLLLIQMLISNDDFSSAINYINHTTNLCLEHLIDNVKDLSDGVFIDDKKRKIVIDKKKDNLILSKKEEELELERAYGDKNIKKIIFNLVILFYYRGVCYENMGKINLSIKCYYQCIWFLNNFFYHGLTRISTLFRNTLEKSLDFKRIVDFINRRIKFYDRIQFFLKKQIEKKKSEEEKKDIMYDNLINGSKLKKLENKLLNLNINEVDTVNRFELKKNVREASGRKREGIYKNIFMSDTRLLNSYLREDFRQIIDGMEQIKTFDIDFVTREKIQKYLRGIYFDQNLKKLRKKNKIQNYKTNYTSNVISKNKNFGTSVNIMNENKNKSRSLQKNNSMPNTTFRKIKTNYQRKSLIPNTTTTTKRKILSPNTTFRLTQVPTSKNCSNIYIQNRRPKSSFSGKRDISYGTQNMKRVFTPISTTRYYFDYKSNTIITPIEKNKQKNKSQRKSLYELKKSYKSIRAQSAKLFKRIPREDKNLNKFFNKKYLRKRNYIKVLEDRDLKFQKCILKIKKEQKPKNEIFTKEIMKQKANELFKRVMGIYLTSPTNWKFNKVQNVNKDAKLNEKLQDALISSLDNAAIIKYNIQKNKERNKSRPMTEQMNLSIKEINDINKNVIKDIDHKIEEIKQKEIIESKNYQTFFNKHNKFIRLKIENEKNFMQNKINTANVSPNYNDIIKGLFSYENNNNKEHYFFNSNKK
jgi:hypothetical protein